MTALGDVSRAVIHEPTTVSELGYERRVCADCLTPWPCQEMVKTYCARNYLAHGLGCDCGWHEEKVAQDLEQEKEGSGCTGDPVTCPACEVGKGCMA